MLNNLLLFKDSNSKMNWLSQRHKTLAQNVANVDTPEYKAADLREQRYSSRFPWDNFAFKLDRSSTNHFGSSTERRGPYRDQRATDGVEVTISRNNVVLDEEVGKISKTSVDYRLVTQLFRKYATLYSTALGERQ